MSPDAVEAIAVLSKRIADLEAENRRLEAENFDLRVKALGSDLDHTQVLIDVESARLNGAMDALGGRS